MYYVVGEPYTLPRNDLAHFEPLCLVTILLHGSATKTQSHEESRRQNIIPLNELRMKVHFHFPDMLHASLLVDAITTTSNQQILAEARSILLPDNQHKLFTQNFSGILPFSQLPCCHLILFYFIVIFKERHYLFHKIGRMS